MMLTGTGVAGAVLVRGRGRLVPRHPRPPPPPLRLHLPCVPANGRTGGEPSQRHHHPAAVAEVLVWVPATAKTAVWKVRPLAGARAWWFTGKWLAAACLVTPPRAVPDPVHWGVAWMQAQGPLLCLLPRTSTTATEGTKAPRRQKATPMRPPQPLGQPRAPGRSFATGRRLWPRTAMCTTITVF